jgi:hypothetical protein
MLSMIYIKNIFLFVILPLILGYFIYNCLREELSGLMLSFFYPCMCVYIKSSLNLNTIYYWIKYNLPDGLWAFSFGSFLYLSFSGLRRKIYLILGFIVAILMEILQPVFINGTFDIIDLLFIELFYITSCLFLRFNSL